jgi:hypothetical protein
VRDELSALRADLRETASLARTLLDLPAAPAGEGRIDSAAGRMAAPFLSILLVGGTQVGKSTLLNALAGEPISETGRGAATTRNAVFYVPDDVLEPDLPFRHGTDRRVAHGSARLAGKVIIDAPDCDSFLASNRERALSLLARADVVLVVSSWEKYNQLSLLSLLRPEIRGRSQASFVFVLNKMDELPASEAGPVLADMRSVLTAAGIAGPAIFPVSALRALEERRASAGSAARAARAAWGRRLAELEEYLEGRLDRKLKESNLARELASGLGGVLCGPDVAGALERFLDATAVADGDLRRAVRAAASEVLAAQESRLLVVLRGIAGERIAGGFGTYLSALTYLAPGRLASLLPVPGMRSPEDALLDSVATGLAQRLSHRLTDALHTYVRRARAATHDLRDSVALAERTRADLDAVGTEPMLVPDRLAASVRPRLAELTDFTVWPVTVRLLNFPSFLLVHAAPILLLWQFLRGVPPEQVLLWVLALPFALLSVLEVERFLYEGIWLRVRVRRRFDELAGALEESVIEATSAGALASTRRAQGCIRTLLDRHHDLALRIGRLESGAAPQRQLPPGEAAP